MVAHLVLGDTEDLRRVGVLLGVRLRVVVVDPHRPGAALPEFVQLVGRHAHAVAVAARFADEQDGREPAGLEAAARVHEQVGEAIVRQRDGAGLGHVAIGVLPAALGDVGHDGRHQRLAERARNLVAGVLHDEPVLAIHHVRALLLGAGGADDHGGRPGLDEVTHLGPGQFLDYAPCRAACPTAPSPAHSPAAAPGRLPPPTPGLLQLSTHGFVHAFIPPTSRFSSP